MRRVLTILGLLLLITFAVCMGCGIWAYMKVQSAVKGYETALAKMTDLETRYPFTPPTDGRLTAEQMERFFAMRDFISSDLKSEPIISEFVAATEAKRTPNVGTIQLMSFIVNYPPGLISRSADEMDRLRMGPGEYAHISRLMYATIAQGKKEGRSDMAELHTKMKEAVEAINAELQRTQGNAQHQVRFDRTIEDLNVQGELPLANYEVLQNYSGRILEFPYLTFFEFLMVKMSADQGHSIPQFSVEPE
jgi:hypothetical protein